MSKQAIKTTIIGAFCAWLGAISAIWAGGHDTPPIYDPAVLDANVNAELEDVVMEMAEGWNSQDKRKVFALWDQDEEVPFYLAEEQLDWFIGWEALRNYMVPERPSPLVDVLRMQPTNVRAKKIVDDLAIAVWDLHFEMKMVGGKPIGEDVRVAGVFRLKEEGWRFIYYAESPKTPKVYIEELFQKDVGDDWDEFYQEARKKKDAVLETY